MINVTKPSLPQFEKFIPYLEEIWNSKILTNNGKFHKQFENELCEYLGIEYISLFNNATIALITALKALDLTGEVITTPYSFVATAHSLHWNNLQPIFVDIDPVTLNIDPTKIENAITPRTTAILAVHVYGFPCDVDSLNAIAKKHNLKVIYDAAHAFGVECHCGSLLSHGDLSILSFHATKVFNTFEGGAIVSPNAETKLRIDKLKNFGFENENTVTQFGINGKMNEFCAALGILQLKYIDEQIARRKILDAMYRKNLKTIKGIRFNNHQEIKKYNYSYFPIFIEKEYSLTRDEISEKLKNNGIYARKYFYPLITEFEVYNEMLKNKFNLKNAEKIANQVICLPLYPELTEDEIIYISEILHNN